MHLLCRHEQRFPRFTRAQSIGGHRESSSTGRTITTRNRTSVCIILFCTSVYKTQSCLTFLSVVIKFISRRFLFFFFSRVKNILTWRFDTEARRCFFVAPRDVSVAFAKKKQRKERKFLHSNSHKRTSALTHNTVVNTRSFANTPWITMMSSSLSASQHVFVQHQQKSSSSLSSRKNSSSSLTIQTTRRHSSKRGVITSSKVSSSQSDVITNNAVQIPTKPTGEPKVVYIFNSKTCDGGAELKDILGNKCVSFSLHPLNARELVTPRVRRNELTEGHVFFHFLRGKKI